MSTNLVEQISSQYWSSAYLRPKYFYNETYISVVRAIIIVNQKHNKNMMTATKTIIT